MQRCVTAIQHQKQPTEVNDALDELSILLSANLLFCFFCHLFNYEANENRVVFFINCFTRQIKDQDRNILLFKVAFRAVNIPQKSRD